MDAEDAGAARIAADGREGRHELGWWSRHNGWQESGYALRQEFQRQRGDIARTHDVEAAAAVNMGVNESRREDAGAVNGERAGRRLDWGGAYGGDTAVRDQHVAAREHPTAAGHVHETEVDRRGDAGMLGVGRRGCSQVSAKSAPVGVS